VLLRGSLLLAFPLLLALYGIKLWRRLALRWATSFQRPRVAYRYALDRLAEVGVTRTTGETREAFARRLSGALPSLPELTAMHVIARLGRPDRDPADRLELSGVAWQRGIERFRGELRGAFGWRRRWLGVLNPVSFFSVR
jgi:hypothetical protein